MEIVSDDENEKKKSTYRVFQTQWSTEFPWLIKLSENCAKCSTCDKNKTDTHNDWATGKTFSKWRKSILKEHQRSKKHRENVLIKPQQQALIVTMEKAFSKAELQTVGLMVNVLAAIQQELSLNSVNFLNNLSDLHIKQTLDALETASNSNVNLPNKHRSLYSTYKIMWNLNKSVVSSENNKFQNTLAICLHIDESTDICATKNLLIYLTICSKDAQYNGQFYGTLLELENECDATTIAHKVNLWITEIGIKKEALVMFTSDGAAVMLERFNGVAEKLRKEYGYFHLLDFHCICHRENLALKDAYQESPDYLYLETIIRQVIAYLSGHSNMVKLSELSRVLGETFYCVKRIIEIRWLSRFRVIGCFIKSIVVILEFLENKKSEDPVAAILFQHLSNTGNLMLLHHLYDILSPMAKLMTQLQADSLHPFDAEKKTKLVITQLEQICLSEAPLSGASFISLCNNVEQKKIRTSDVWTRAIREECDIKAKNLVRIIIANLNNRMWNNNQVIESFKIFDSDGIKSIKGCALLEYGHTSLERLILHYKHVQNLDEIAIKLEWEYYKFQYLKPLFESNEPNVWKDGLSQCITEEDTFPNLRKLAATLLCFRAQNATVERGFSMLNRIKTKLRNRLSVPVIDALLQLRLSTKAFNKFDYKPALKLYVQSITYSIGVDLPNKRRLQDLNNNDDQDENLDDEAYNCFMEIAEKGF